MNEGGKPVPGSSVQYARPACRPASDSARYRRGRGEVRARGRTAHKESICTQGDRYTDKKENQIFLINKEIQSGAVAKSYMRKSFLIYEEIKKNV